MTAGTLAVDEPDDRHELLQAVLEWCAGEDDGIRRGEAMADDGPTIEDQIELGIIDLKRGRLDAAAERFRKNVPAWGYYFRPQIAREYVQAGLPGPALDHLEETFRAEPALRRSGF